MTYTVYALFDVRELDCIRYIGFSKDPETRFKHHLYEALKTSAKSHRLNWIRKVVAEGSSIIWKPITVVATADDAAVCERGCIAEYLRVGHPLVNGTEGGEGVQGFGGKLTEEALERRNATMNSPEYLTKRGEQSSDYWSDESAREHQREKMEAWWASPESDNLRKVTSERSKIQMADPEYRAKLHSEEARKKMSDFMTGRPHPHTPEWNARISEALTGLKKPGWTPEVRARHMAAFDLCREKMSASASARTDRKRRAMTPEERDRMILRMNEPDAVAK